MDPRAATFIAKKANNSSSFRGEMEQAICSGFSHHGPCFTGSDLELRRLPDDGGWSLWAGGNKPWSFGIFHHREVSPTKKELFVAGLAWGRVCDDEHYVDLCCSPRSVGSLGLTGPYIWTEPINSRAHCAGLGELSGGFGGQLVNGKGGWDRWG